jgi:hypothetical protein
MVQPRGTPRAQRRSSIGQIMQLVILTDEVRMLLKLVNSNLRFGEELTLTDLDRRKHRHTLELWEHCESWVALLQSP